MRHQYRYLIFKSNKQARELITKLNRNLCTANEMVSTLDLFPEETDDLQLIDSLQKLGVKPCIINLYTDEELYSAEWLEIAPKLNSYYPEPQDTYEQTTYRSTSSCSCKSGLVQVENFIIKHNVRKLKEHFLQLNWVFDEIFISQQLKSALSDSGLRGFDYRDVYCQKTKKNQTNILQLVIPTLLPPAFDFSKTSIEMDTSCLICGTHRYFLAAGTNLFINAEAFNKVDVDIVKLCEFFGQGGIWSHKILISHNFYKFLVENNFAAGLRYEVPILSWT